METFTIDSENNIAAHAAVPANLDNQQAFATEKELAKLSAEWPGSRLVEIWNSFVGVAPFSQLGFNDLPVGFAGARRGAAAWLRRRLFALRVGGHLYGRFCR